MNKKYAASQKCGNWNLIRRVENGKSRVPRYLCECDCGNRKEITIAMIRRSRGHCEKCRSFACRKPEIKKRMALCPCCRKQHEERERFTGNGIHWEFCENCLELVEEPELENLVPYMASIY